MIIKLRQKRLLVHELKESQVQSGIVYHVLKCFKLLKDYVYKFFCGKDQNTLDTFPKTQG